jgi:DNA sulfur modification protein DndE
MITNRIRVSTEATDKMKQLRSRLRISPMYAFARLGLSLSLSEEKPPQEEFYIEDGMEFNRLTLFGDYDAIFTSMLKEYGLYKKTAKGAKLQKLDELSSKEATSYLVAHINRGVNILFNRVKSQNDLYELIESSGR